MEARAEEAVGVVVEGVCSLLLRVTSVSVLVAVVEVRVVVILPTTPTAWWGGTAETAESSSGIRELW